MSNTQGKTQTVTNGGEIAIYKKTARKKYDQLFAEMEFYCERATMMHQYEASRYDRQSFYMETAAEILGASSVASMGVVVFQENLNLMNNRMGMAAMGGLLLAGGLEFLGKGKGMALTVVDRAEKHKKSAAGWQRLARITESYRILMDDPRHDVTQFAHWYKELLDVKQDIANIVNVPDSTLELFDDPVEVIKPLRKSKVLFHRYVDLQKGNIGTPPDE